MKVAINSCYGGFDISHEAIMRYAEIKGINIVSKIDKDYDRLIHYYTDEESEDNYFESWELERDDPALIQVIEELGEKANGPYADLKIVEIPDGVEWELCEYDGIEHIAEKHRTWR